VAQPAIQTLTKSLLIPLHGLLQALHGPGHPVNVLGLCVDAQGDIAARHGSEHILLLRQVPSHQGKQVAGLREGVLPNSKMPANPLSVMILSRTKKT
jgi:hypothetical protein